MYKSFADWKLKEIKMFCRHSRQTRKAIRIYFHPGENNFPQVKIIFAHTKQSENKFSP